MNIYQSLVFEYINNNNFNNQREIASKLNISLGKVNQAFNTLIEAGYLFADGTITESGQQLLIQSHPKNAVILAAGYGLRMVPINTEIPKGLLEVNGEPLIERIIKQLQEVGVSHIFVVVGYQKEKYEYLIDTFGVELVVNMDYSTKNNLHSLYKASAHLGNTYIVPCDLWCRNNPFSDTELYSWYMVSDRMSINSSVKYARQKTLISAPGNAEGNSMLGISYLTQDAADYVKEHLNRCVHDHNYDNSFWEDTLFPQYKNIYGNLVSDQDVIEINTFEQLRSINHNPEQLNSTALNIITETFHCSVTDISHIDTLKKGMTNRSFLFSVDGRRYIMRIPGEGTDLLINRQQEAAVYKALGQHAISDDVLYMNPENGYKITAFLQGARNCDPFNESDIALCMNKLKSFHSMALKVDHSFDIFGQIEYYESLWKQNHSLYRDYETTKKNVCTLKHYIDSMEKESVLTHIDAVPDNFLMIDSDAEIRLIDWEYSGMQDPHVDIAMFGIYSLYNKQQMDHLIDVYFDNNCSNEARCKIYCYIAACGLLWSNWCEYKSHLGIEFGEYALKQYRYAKDYYRYAVAEMENMKNE